MIDKSICSRLISSNAYLITLYKALVSAAQIARSSGGEREGEIGFIQTRERERKKI